MKFFPLLFVYFITYAYCFYAVKSKLKAFIISRITQTDFRSLQAVVLFSALTSLFFDVNTFVDRAGINILDFHYIALRQCQFFFRKF